MVPLLLKILFKQTKENQSKGIMKEPEIIEQKSKLTKMKESQFSIKNHKHSLVWNLFFKPTVIYWIYIDFRLWLNDANIR